jgi:hypothetical protein
VKLNEHIFGNIPLKVIDFKTPPYKSQFKIQRPQTKKEIFNHQLEKLGILISTYSEEEFEQIKFSNLNSDQILVFLGNPNFITGNAKKIKVV